MNYSWKYLIGIDWMTNMAGITDIDGANCCKFVEDGDMLHWNGNPA